MREERVETFDARRERPLLVVDGDHDVDHGRNRGGREAGSDAALVTMDIVHGGHTGDRR